MQCQEPLRCRSRGMALLLQPLGCGHCGASAESACLDHARTSPLPPCVIGDRVSVVVGRNNGLWSGAKKLSRKAAAFKSRGGGKAVMEVLTKSKKIFLQREGEPQTKCCSGTQVRTHARTRLLLVAPPAA